MQDKYKIFNERLKVKKNLVQKCKRAHSIQRFNNNPLNYKISYPKKASCYLLF